MEIVWIVYFSDKNRRTSSSRRAAGKSAFSEQSHLPFPQDLLSPENGHPGSCFFRLEPYALLFSARKKQPARETQVRLTVSWLGE